MTGIAFDEEHLPWEESWPLVERRRCWRVVADVGEIDGLQEAAGWKMSSALDDVIRAELWFGREGIMPDEWTFAILRGEIGRACGLHKDEWLRGEYAQQIAFEQSRLLLPKEAADLMTRIEDVSFLSRPRMIRQDRLHWSEGFDPESSARAWPTHLFGESPPFATLMRLVLLI